MVALPEEHRRTAATQVAARDDVDDIDVTYRERENVVIVPDGDLGPVRMQAALPHVRTASVAIGRTGAPLGADYDLVYGDWLDLDDEPLDGITGGLA